MQKIPVPRHNITGPMNAQCLVNVDGYKVIISSASTRNSRRIDLGRSSQKTLNCPDICFLLAGTQIILVLAYIDIVKGAALDGTL